MKRILILGSKPGAVLPDQVDYVYAANASAHFYSDKIPSSSSLKIVASPGALYGTDLLKQPKFYKVVNSLRGNLIVSGVDKVPGAQKKISEEIRVESIEYYSAKMRREIFFSVIGGSLVGPTLLSCLFKDVKPAYFIKYLYHLTRSRVLGTDAPGQYRPSTGMFALALAISEHSGDSQYILSGIGFDQRSNYPDGSEVSARGNPHHLIPDMLCLAELSKKNRIFTTDSDISKLFSIPLWGFRDLVDTMT